jgi:predicted AlkP superfamily pyrophosphatase or phosphodiesterase
MRVLCSLLCVFLSFNSFSQEKDTLIYQTEYAVVLIIDGVRFTESFGDSTCSYIPNLCSILKEQGVLYTNFRANAPRTTTNAGHTAITTGVNQRISNDGKQLPKYPSMFQYLMKEQNINKNKLWVISSKGKLSILGNTKHRKWRDLYTPHVFCGKNGNGKDYIGDKMTMEQVRLVLDLFAPKLLLINLLAPDSYGHGNDWNGYLRSIKESDEYALELWNLIQSNPEMKDKTTLFITNDHGRNADGHKDGFISHGDGSEGNRHIFLLAIGPDFEKDVIITKERELTDISATIAELLHFKIPTGKGNVMRELIKKH